MVIVLSTPLKTNSGYVTYNHTFTYIFKLICVLTIATYNTVVRK